MPAFPAKPSATAGRPPRPPGHEAATETTDGSLLTVSRMDARLSSFSTRITMVSLVRMPRSTLAAAQELARKTNMLSIVNATATRPRPRPTVLTIVSATRGAPPERPPRVPHVPDDALDHRTKIRG